MGSDFWIMLLKIIIFLPFILLLFYLSIKYGGNKLQKIQNGRYIKILERVPLTKDNSLLVVKIGNKGYILTSTIGKIETLLELDETELLKVENTKEVPEFASIKDFYQKVLKKKED